MAGKRKIFIIIFAIMAFVFAGIILKKGEFSLFDRAAIVSHYDASSLKGQTVIAVCPTFHYMVEKLEGKNEEIRVIRTQSTAESFDLLKQGSVDLVVSGRALKPEEGEESRLSSSPSEAEENKFSSSPFAGAREPDLLFKIIGPGYDFLFSEEILILEKDMRFIPFYTNLSLEEIIRDFDYISENNLAKAEDIYEYLDKGIVITLLENRTKGEMVHVLEEDGSRLRLSRLPRLYYSFGFEEEKLNFIKEIIKEN